MYVFTTVVCEIIQFKIGGLSMENQFCPNCGSELIQGQQFCTKCGQALNNKKENLCSKCGAELLDDQEFCTKCGQKKGVALDTNVSSAIAQFNDGLTKKKKNKGLKVALFVSIPCVLIAASIIVVSLLNSFGGKYVYVSGDSDGSYTFDDGEYKYKYDDTTKEGTYQKEKNTITLTDEDGDKTVFIRKGDYIYNREVYYEEKLESGSKVSQTITRSTSFTSNGERITIKSELKLSSDGTYKYELTMGSGSTWIDVSDQSGKYEIDDDVLKLSPSGKSYDEIYLIVNGRVYTSVYKKN
jgi:ribosomal protein S27AE